MTPDERLSLTRPGQTVRVVGLETRGGMRRRLMDIGFIEGARLECVGASPLGDPKAYLVRGAVIAIRAEDARNIVVSRAIAGRGQEHGA